MSYDNFKSHKKPRFHPSLEDTFFTKTQSGGGPAVLGLRRIVISFFGSVFMMGWEILSIEDNFFVMVFLLRGFIIICVRFQ